MSDPRSVERLDAKDFMDEREYGKIDAIGPHNSCQTKCEESRTDECTQFDEYLVFVGKQLIYTIKRGWGDDTSFGRWQTTMAHGMRLLDETRQSNSIY